MSQESKTRQLLLAIEQSNVELARKLILEDKLKPTDVSKEQYCKFIKRAVELRDVPIVRALLEVTPKLDATFAAELLWVVVRDEDTEISWMLIEAGADLNQPNPNDPSGRTFISELAQSKSNPKRHELALSIIDRGVDITVKDASNCSPLFYAIMSHNLDFIRQFLERGALIDEHALAIVAFLPPPMSVELMLLLVNGDHVKDAATRTELMAKAFNLMCHFSAISEKAVDVIKALLDHGADVNAVDVYGRTPFSVIKDDLLIEARRLIIKRFALLTSKGATVNEQDLAHISSCPNLQQFYDECLRELQEMIEIKFFNGISLFSTFMKSHKELSLLFRSLKFYEDYRDKLISFSVYGDDLNCQFRKAEKRNDLLMPKVDALYEVLGEFLPDFPMEKIVRHLYFSDFEVSKDTATMSGS